MKKEDIDYINKLIERFFEGTTNVEEEKILYQVFNREDLPEELTSYQPVFSYFREEVKDDLIRLEKKESRWLPKRRLNIFRLTTLTGIAAAILAIICIAPFTGTSQEYDLPYDNCYIIKNGIKITDPAIVEPQLKALLASLEEKEYRKEKLFSRWEDKENKFEMYEKLIQNPVLPDLKKISNKMVREEINKILSESE